VKPYALAALVSVIAMALYVWQDGIHDCNDGNRYTSGKAQPYPFHRRFCGWPKKLLQASTYLGLLGLCMMLGTPTKAALLMSLPGAWFIATHPTTVDATSMALAFSVTLMAPVSTGGAIALSLLAGFVHERGPVFAALYAWSPWPLLGLAAVGWWRKPACPDGDRLVGHGLVRSIVSHKPYTDWLDWKVNALSLRGVPLLAAYHGVSIHAWVALAVAWLSRLVGTDGARFLFWAAPALLREVPDPPLWFAMIHVVTFRRMI
jgi:hypothetical protein